jgi:hypothetical protein
MKKTLLLLAAILIPALFIGCTTTSRNPEARGVITKKEFDAGQQNCYYTAGSLVCAMKPEAYWLRVKGDNGKNYTLVMRDAQEVEAWTMLEVGDRWPQR